MFRDDRSEMIALGTGGASLALILGLFLPFAFMFGINDNTSDLQEGLCYLCYLSSIPAFLVAGRRPVVGGVWRVAVGAMELQLRLPPAQPFQWAELLTPLFWPAELPIVGGIVILLLHSRVSVSEKRSYPGG